MSVVQASLRDTLDVDLPADLPEVVQHALLHEGIIGAWRDPESGRYRVDMERMRDAMNALSGRILTFQGDGDYDGVAAFVQQYGNIGPELQGDLDRVNEAGIPVDVVFEQGRSVLGL